MNRWSLEEDRILLDHVAKHGTKHWKLLEESGRLPNRDNRSCYRRYCILSSSRARLSEATQDPAEETVRVHPFSERLLQGLSSSATASALASLDSLNNRMEAGSATLASAGLLPTTSGGHRGGNLWPASAVSLDSAELMTMAGSSSLRGTQNAMVSSLSALVGQHSQEGIGPARSRQSMSFPPTETSLNTPGLLNPFHTLTPHLPPLLRPHANPASSPMSSMQNPKFLAHNALLRSSPPTRTPHHASDSSYGVPDVSPCTLSGPLFGGAHAEMLLTQRSRSLMFPRVAQIEEREVHDESPFNPLQLSGSIPGNDEDLMALLAHRFAPRSSTSAPASLGGVNSSRGPGSEDLHAMQGSIPATGSGSVNLRAAASTAVLTPRPAVSPSGSLKRKEPPGPRAQHTRLISAINAQHVRSISNVETNSLEFLVQNSLVDNEIDGELLGTADAALAERNVSSQAVMTHMLPRVRDCKGEEMRGSSGQAILPGAQGEGEGVHQMLEEGRLQNSPMLSEPESRVCEDKEVPMSDETSQLEQLGFVSNEVEAWEGNAPMAGGVSSTRGVQRYSDLIQSQNALFQQQSTGDNSGFTDLDLMVFGQPGLQ